MTRSEAVSLLYRYKMTEYRCRPKGIFCLSRGSEFETASYGRTLMDELIRRIRSTPGDPILTVGRMYCDLDYALGESADDRIASHRFLAKMELECGNALRYLKEKEKEKNDGN